jgi:hypothetical protein
MKSDIGDEHETFREGNQKNERSNRVCGKRV